MDYRNAQFLTVHVKCSEHGPLSVMMLNVLHLEERFSTCKHLDLYTGDNMAAYVTDEAE